jgi:hypothetical protein
MLNDIVRRYRKIDNDVDEPGGRREREEEAVDA